MRVVHVCVYIGHRYAGEIPRPMQTTLHALTLLLHQGQLLFFCSYVLVYCVWSGRIFHFTTDLYTAAALHVLMLSTNTILNIWLENTFFLFGS